MGVAVLRMLQKEDDKKVRAIAELARIWDESYVETENLVKKMEQQLKHPDKMQRVFEKSLDNK